MNNIVILGGGYGGLTVALQLLQGPMPKDAQITLVDRQPYQGLKTEYYALAVGSVSDADIRVPFPVDPRLILMFGEVTSVDLEQKVVRFMNDDPLGYDTLVIALGCTDNYHGIPGAEPYSHSIQTISATRMTYGEIAGLKPYGQVTIVGGGLSGVELASELRESRPDLNIRILDRGASVLSIFPNKLVHYVQKWFLEHDVEIVPHIHLSRVEQGILYNREQPIFTDLTIWTAGIQPSVIVQKISLPKDVHGRLLINEYHQLAARPEVFIAGDCASLPFSPSAQAAEAQGRQIAEVIRAGWNGEKPRLSPLKLKGVLGSLGKKTGFGLMGNRTVITGRVPRVLKSGVLWMSRHHFG